MATFAEQLLAARKAAGMTQQQLADAVHVTRAAISHWETGRTIPDFDVIRQLEQALACSFTHSGGTAGEECASDPAGEQTRSAPARKDVRKRLLIAAACVLLAALVCFAVIGIRALTNPAPDAREYASDTGDGTRYRMADFQAVTPNTAGRAYLTVDSGTSTTRGDNASFWMYTFTLREDNGVAYHIDRMENIWFKTESAHPFIFMADDLQQAGYSPDIPARGQFSFDGGFPLDQPDMVGVGLRVYGHDENGAESCFTGYIPFPKP